MNIFLASASFDEIRWATSAGLADGVLVSDALFDSELLGTTARARALQIARSFPVPVILSLGTQDAAELYDEARDGMKQTDHMILEFPFSAGTADALHRAVENGVRVAASMIFTPAQALLAAKCGASAVLVHINALEAQGSAFSTSLRDTRSIFDTHRIECEIIAVTPRSAAQVGACAAAGVDGMVLEPSVLRDVLVHPMSGGTLDDLLSSSPSAYARSLL
jgi:transaldolase